MMEQQNTKRWAMAGLMAFFLFAFAPVFGQQQPEARAKALTDKMKAQLTLNEEQYRQAYDINLQFVNGLAQARQSGGGRRSMMKQVKEMDRQRDQALKGMLSKAQYDQYLAQKKENRQSMKDKYRKGA